MPSGFVTTSSGGSGKVRWISQQSQFENEEKKKNAIYWTGPVLAGERLWFANSRGEIHSAGIADGQSRLFAEVKAPITLAPIVAGGTLYVLDDSGRITAFR